MKSWLQTRQTVNAGHVCGLDKCSPLLRSYISLMGQVAQVC